MKAGESMRHFIRRSAFTPGPSNPQLCELVKTEETSYETTSSSVGHVASADAENEGFLKKAIKKEVDEDGYMLIEAGIKIS
ncbi:zinc finger protein 347-like [Tachysurus ichikawai]